MGGEGWPPAIADSRRVACLTAAGATAGWGGWKAPRFVEACVGVLKHALPLAARGGERRQNRPSPASPRDEPARRRRGPAFDKSSTPSWSSKTQNSTKAHSCVHSITRVQHSTSSTGEWVSCRRICKQVVGNRRRAVSRDDIRHILAESSTFQPQGQRGSSGECWDHRDRPSIGTISVHCTSAEGGGCFLISHIATLCSRPADAQGVRALVVRGFAVAPVRHGLDALGKSSVWSCRAARFVGSIIRRSQGLLYSCIEPT